ncbi:MAG: hypothetical protein JXJ30_08215 [Halothiobacillaceae bacterium]|nr:hypothetical protein [Halothiobacillaceae bacterium]
MIAHDGHLARFGNHQGDVALLCSNDTRALAAESTSHLHIDRLARPISRCLGCNTPLRPIRGNQIGRSPAGRRDSIREGRYCACCDTLLWRGSHVRRRRRTVSNFPGAMGSYRSIGSADGRRGQLSASRPCALTTEPLTTEPLTLNR